jgi:hypothetical protein
MKFFFPDAQDFIDPGFDFDRETYTSGRVRQRDDRYAHEVFPTPPYDGMLISKAIVESRVTDKEKKYSDPQRRRLLFVGAHEFFRLKGNLKTMGDCGAFSYIREKEPPVTVDEVIDFYEACGFDRGVSIDHVILGYNAAADNGLPGIDLVPDDWRERQEITVELAAAFLRRHGERRCRFEPIGAAQGWSPRSYAACVSRLQKMGYRTIGLGGMVPLKGPEVLACLEAIASVRHTETQLHLFGVTRPALVPQFVRYGVTSFDSTSPLKQAFMDDDDNYYTEGCNYTAIRVPQVEKNPKLKKRILAGAVKQETALQLERECLQGLAAYDKGMIELGDLLGKLREYELLLGDRTDRSPAYREVLTHRPWEQCGCAICTAVGIQVIIFRGAERNRRRGYHNLWVTYNALQGTLAREGSDG